MASKSITSTASASTTSSGSALSGKKPGQRRLRSLITTDLLLVPPGEVLLEEFLRPMQISHDLKLTKQALASVLPAIKPLQQI